MNRLLSTLAVLILAGAQALAAAASNSTEPRVIVHGNTVVPPTQDRFVISPNTGTPDKRTGLTRTGRSSSVKLTEEKMEIPTYELGPSEPNPIFYSHESYQGAQKRIYPYALQDNLTHLRTNKTYKALKLENNYIRLIVLPELGGHLFEAVDKSNGYDIFYRQHVIKPALIGMLGAWMSGGIEWCVFHHHRNTTFMPVDYTLADNPDGSKTIWFGETERRHRMRWTIGLTLYPDKSYIEATVRFFNRTPVPNSILYWANVAVSVNDNYQVIFPPSVQAATFHSKIDFTTWPIGSGKYRGYDYSGIDQSWWKNSPDFNSFFAWQLQEDFMGGYDHGQQAGVVHVADHHVVGGAKLWEWGTGPFGRRWDKILTDDDGPYAELMVGAFSDNQPDYSWIKPYEVKTFKQYWYPVSDIGGFKNANLDAAVNLELRTNGTALFAFNTTARFAKAKALLKSGKRVLSETLVEIAPGRTFRKELAVPAGTKETDLRASLETPDGKVIIAYQPVVRTLLKDFPSTVKAPPEPKDIQSIEELYLTGMRIEQIHNPTADPTLYYKEVLARDPGESRANTALGLSCLKRGCYPEAERHFTKALERLTADYTRPANAEANFYLGLTLRAQGKPDAAYDQFFRASWDSAFYGPARYQLAELAAHQSNYVAALEHLNEALAANAHNSKARAFKAALQRRLGRLSDAQTTLAMVLRSDPLDFLALNEQCLVLAARNNDIGDERAALRTVMRDDVQNYLELATDYLGWGFYDDAIAVLRRPIELRIPFASTYPLVHYYLGYLYGLKGDPSKAAEFFGQASRAPSDYCFPFRLETLDALNAALALNPEDARAFYYMGNLLCDLQPDKALECWDKARSLTTDFAPVLRNLGWANYRLKNNLTNAMGLYEQAIALRPNDPRLYFELDSLYEFANAAPERRLELFEKHHDTARTRVESFTREVAVLVLAGRYDPAIGHLATNTFHVREGAGEIHDIYVDAHLLKGLQQLKAGDAPEALKHFQAASEYPENLAVGRSRNDPRAPQIAYCAALACEAAGNKPKAEDYLRKCTQPDPENRAEARYYQALAWRKLKDTEKSNKAIDKLIQDGNSALNKQDTADFFAKFGEQETRQARKASAHFTLGLAYLAKDDKAKAKPELDQAATLNRSNPWHKYFLTEAQ